MKTIKVVAKELGTTTAEIHSAVEQRHVHPTEKFGRLYFDEEDIEDLKSFLAHEHLGDIPAPELIEEDEDEDEI